MIHHTQVAEIDVLEIIRKPYFVKTSLLNEKILYSETQSNEIQVIVITTQKKCIMSSDNSVPTSLKFIFGGLSGAGAACCVQPIDLVKKRMQV